MRTSTSGSGRPMVLDWSSGESSSAVWVITPCSSVWPNTIVNRQPSVSFVRTTSSAGTNDAPDITDCRLERSRFGRSGWVSTAVSMVGTSRVIVPR